MAKVIKNVSLSWEWTGDERLLLGFNVALCKSGETPLTAITASAFVGMRGTTVTPVTLTPSYTFSNVTLDDGVQYIPFVQTVFPGDDSEWLASTGVLVDDDGTATISMGITRTADLEVFQWATSAPVAPSGTSTYTWATGEFTAPTVPNGWELTPGTATPGDILWGSKVRVVDYLSTATTEVVWPTGSSILGELKAFPYAEGFGSSTIGGRGGTIYTVKNLNNSGADSLRAALEATGPRIVVFEVSGTIALTSPIYITSPYLTIAGQTAPSPGINIRNYGINIRTHDILIQHLRMRMGDSYSDIVGPFYIQHYPNQNVIYNVVIDHCSISWGRDDCITFHYYSHDLTLSHSILSEGLEYDAGNSRGILVSDRVKNLSIIKNLVAHQKTRFPEVNIASEVVHVNNLLYNGGLTGWVPIVENATENPAGEPIKFTSENNHFLEGPNSVYDQSPYYIYSNISSTSEIYISGSEYAGTSDLVTNYKGAGVIVEARPLWDASITVLPTADVHDYVLAYSGARPADRDAVDTRIVGEVEAGTGSWRSSVAGAGGWPTITENTRSLTGLMPSNPSATIDAQGWTQMDKFLYEQSMIVSGYSPVTSAAYPVGIAGISGVDGSNALSVIVSNPAHTLPASSAGAVSSYSGSGTTIRVLEGGTYLTDTAVNPPTVAGTFTVEAGAQVPSATITAGSISGAGTTTATIADYSAMADGTTAVVVNWTVKVKMLDGTSVTLSTAQSLTKSLAGVDGTSGVGYYRSTDPPGSPAQYTLWFNTQDTDGTYYAQTQYQYVGSSWVPTSARGTYIGSTGIYTGTLTATQVNAVAIDAGSITTGTLYAIDITGSTISGSLVIGAIIGNNVTALTSDWDIINTTISVKDTTNFASSGIATLGTKSDGTGSAIRITYTGKTGTTLTGVALDGSYYTAYGTVALPGAVVDTARWTGGYIYFNESANYTAITGNGTTNEWVKMSSLHYRILTKATGTWVVGGTTYSYRITVATALPADSLAIIYFRQFITRSIGTYIVPDSKVCTIDSFSGDIRLFDYVNSHSELVSRIGLDDDNYYSGLVSYASFGNWDSTTIGCLVKGGGTYSLYCKNIGGGYGASFATSVGSASTASGAPIRLSPSPLSAAPTHTASMGSLWVTSAGVLYINTSDSTTWAKVGAQ